MQDDLEDTLSHGTSSILFAVHGKWKTSVDDTFRAVYIVRICGENTDCTTLVQSWYRQMKWHIKLEITHSPVRYIWSTGLVVLTCRFVCLTEIKSIWVRRRTCRRKFSCESCLGKTEPFKFREIRRQYWGIPGAYIIIARHSSIWKAVNHSVFAAHLPKPVFWCKGCIVGIWLILDQIWRCGGENHKC